MAEDEDVVVVAVKKAKTHHNESEDEEVVVLTSGDQSDGGLAGGGEEVRAWLRTLDYEQHAPCLLRAGFDSLRAVQYLTDPLLRQCGVNLAGHRRVLAAAALELRKQRAVEECEETRELLARYGHLQSPQRDGTGAFAVPSTTSVSPRTPRRTASAASLSPSHGSTATTPSSQPSPRDAAAAASPPSSGKRRRTQRSPHAAASQDAPTSTPVSFEEGMRGLFGELLDRPRMFMMKKPITPGQFNTINDLLGIMVDHEQQNVADRGSGADV